MTVLCLSNIGNWCSMKNKVDEIKEILEYGNTIMIEFANGVEGVIAIKNKNEEYLNKLFGMIQGEQVIKLFIPSVENEK